MVGGIYYWGQGVAVDYSRAVVAYKVGAEGGHAHSQHQLGAMYYQGRGVDVDYAQALAWTKKAADRDLPSAVHALGTMYSNGQGVTPSFRRAREYCERAIELGCSDAVKNMQAVTRNIQKVTSHRSIHSASSLLVRDLTLPPPSSPARARIFPRTRSLPPSWTSGWRSTARAGRT